jgi:hypothetical protein
MTMSKIKGVTKDNWIEVDRRIRDRQKFWENEQVREYDTMLSTLPDLADQFEIIDIEQPAIASSAADQAEQGEGEEATVAADAPSEQPSADEPSN